MMTFLIDSLLTAQILVSLLLVLVVLLQRPRSEGLGTAFASGMVEQYIGPATSVLVRFTTWMGGLFFFLTIALAFLYSHEHNTKTAVGQSLRNAPTPVVKPSPAALASPGAAASPAAVTAPVVVPAVVAPAASASPVLTASPAPSSPAPVESVAPTPAASANP